MGGGVVDKYVSGLEGSLRLSHEVAREKLCAAQKLMKRDYDLHLHERKYKVRDLVYWRWNVGKVESVWLGPGMVAKVKSDTTYLIWRRRQNNIMHHDRLKSCNLQQIPKWIRDYKDHEYKESVSGEAQNRLPNNAPKASEKTGKGASTSDSAPYLRTRSRTGVDRLGADSLNKP